MGVYITLVNQAILLSPGEYLLPPGERGYSFLLECHPRCIEQSRGNFVPFHSMFLTVLVSCIIYIVVVVLLFYVHGKHLRSCWDGQLT